MDQKKFIIYRDRARLFLERLKENLFFESLPLKAEIYTTKQPVAFSDRLSGNYREIREGESWGEAWDSAWIHLTGTVPAEWAGRPVWCRLYLGGELLICDAQGVPFYGLTHMSVYDSSYRKDLFPITETAEPGSKIDLWGELAANGLFGIQGITEDSGLGRIRTMRFGHFNTAAWELCNDFAVLYSLLESMPATDYRAVQINMALNDAVSAYADNPANAAAARACLAKQLALPAEKSALTTIAVGHAHIDTGWLWPVRETIRKCARTFASQIYNLERYPDYVFGASAAQHYAFVKEYYPELYEKIREKIKEGRWEIQGGMWVEADCNIISGESMVRQFLYGKNFFMDEFGFDVKNLWIPDVFGYSASMPQIIKKSGCDYFITQKISWSQFNKFPYHTFLWRGIDNTEVLTHFPPEDSYNSWMLPGGLRKAQDNFNENYFLPEFLTLTGIGDGGGGPKLEHIEYGLRSANLEGVPHVKFGRADKFLERLSKFADKLPQWVGELYLELHRGTLTTQSRTKRNNRKCEQMLTAAEFLCSCLPVADYPADELDALWKKVLLNQFHDIIPGSSIHKVYENTEAEHAEVLKRCAALIETAAEKLLRQEKDAVTVLNTLSYDYTSPVRLPDEWAGCSVTDESGREILTQTENGALWALGNFPPQSFTTLTRGKASGSVKAGVDKALVLENDLVRYEFDSDARLLRAFDKTANREVVCGAAGNLLGLYVDEPNNWDAWDVDFTYQDVPPVYVTGSRAEKVAAGPVRQVLEFELAVDKSKIRQQVVLAANSKRLDFNTEVDWNEHHRMLRVTFPTAIRAAEARCDIQYGYITRPTHRNTLWDFARFEVAAQRYVDIADANGGAALLNDCKYGYKLLDGVLDLNLLRSPENPDPEADLGHHSFTYSFLPHEGGLVGSEVIQEAACLNRAPLVLPGRSEALMLPCRLVGGAGASLEVLKLAYKRDERIIRVVETDGCNSTARLALEPGRKLVETNLVEWSSGMTLNQEDGVVEIPLKPFEIRTFRIR